MKHLHLGAVTLSLGVLLSACGGGGSGPSLDVDGERGDPPITSSHVRTQFTTIGEMADRLTTTGLKVWYQDGGTMVGSDCGSSARCTPATDEFGLIFTPQNLSVIPHDAAIRSRGNQQGMPVVEYSGTSNSILQFGSLSRPNSVNYHTLGGWLDYSFFTVNQWTFEGTEWQIWNGASTGLESGSNPVSGSTVWTGAMVGRTRGLGYPEPGAPVTGDSRLTFDFARNDLDVALTGIRSDNGTAYTDLTWEDVPVTQGQFGSSGGLSGTFYGPNHEEVGGVFERDQMIGAFGAKRQ